MRPKVGDSIFGAITRHWMEAGRLSGSLTLDDIGAIGMDRPGGMVKGRKEWVEPGWRISR